MTMAVELRMTAITGVLELRSGLNPSGKLVVSLYKVVLKTIINKIMLINNRAIQSHYRVFVCVQYVEK